jgi:hypothetical protein
VTLRASVVRRRGKSESALMLQMARGTRRSEGLIRLVNGSIVTRQAGFVAHILCKTADPADVAQVALLREGRMCLGKWTARVRLLPALHALCEKPA